MAKESSRAFRLVDEVKSAPAPVRVEAPSPVAPPRTERADKGASDFRKERMTPPRRLPRTDGTTEEDSVSAAVARATALLEYGDTSRHRLIRKLTDRGFTEEVASAAADRMEAMGFLREADACRRRAEQGLRKGWGPLRVTEDLHAQRYPRALIDEVMSSLSDEEDYTARCAAVIRKKYRGVPEDRDERRRMTAALARLGYSVSTVRAAMETVSQEDA